MCCFNKKLPVIGIVIALFFSYLFADNSGPRVDAVLVDEVVGPPGWSRNDFDGINLKINFHHVPTIQETSPGKFVAVWYISNRGGERDLHIAACYKHGPEWSMPSVIVPMRAGYNPGLLQPKRDPKANLYLYSRKGITADGFVYESPDEGIHWRVPPEGKLFKNSSEAGAPQTGLPLPTWQGNCTQRFLGLIKNPGLELPDGSIFVGSSTECKGWRCHIEVAPYGNYTGANTSAGKWSAIMNVGDFIQPSFLVHSGDYKKLQVTGRALSPKNALVTATSSDGGKTWGGTTRLKNVGEQGHCSVTLDNGYHVVLGEEPSRRFIYLGISKNGTDLEDVLHLQAKDNPGGAYPVVIQASDRKVHVVYASYSKNLNAHIRHVVLDPDVLAGKTAEGGPTISDQPKPTQAALGGKGKFSVTASGSGELYYQWQRNTGKGLWLNLGRAATLETEAAKAEMDGWEYRVVVTDDKGSTLSDPAKLTVNSTPIIRTNKFGLRKGISILKIDGGVRIDFTATSPGMALYDLHGRKISELATGNGNSSITIRQPMGMYFLRSTNGDIRCLLISP
jgi:hypothetical protein